VCNQSKASVAAEARDVLQVRCCDDQRPTTVPCNRVVVVCIEPGIKTRLGSVIGVYGARQPDWTLCPGSKNQAPLRLRTYNGDGY